MPEKNPPTGNWTEYKRLVLAELERLDKGNSELHIKLEGTQKEYAQELAKAHKEISLLQQRAGIIGAIAGAVLSGVFIVLVELLKG